MEDNKKVHIKESIDSILDQKEMSFNKVTDDNWIEAIDADGNKEQINIKQLIADSNNIPVENLKLELNDKEKPVEVSPLSIIDRAKLGIGNLKGNLKYLKEKGYDAVSTNENGILISKGNMWHKMDPSMLGKGDAWDKTREMGSELAENINIPIEGAAEVAGAAIGGSIGAVIGAGAGALTLNPASVAASSIAGRGVGTLVGTGLAAAATSHIRHSFGRMAGTYDASPEEQMADEMLEVMIAMGMPVVGRGVKPAKDLIAKGVKGTWNTLSATNKSMITGMFSFVHKIPKESIESLFELPGKVMGRARHISKKLENINSKNTIKSSARDVADNEIVGKTLNILNRFPQEINKQMAKHKSIITNHIGTNKINFNVGEDATNVISELSGLGFIAKNKKGMHTVSDDFIRKSMELGDDAKISPALRSGLSTKANRILSMLDQASKLKGPVRGGQMIDIGGGKMRASEAMFKLKQEFSEAGKEMVAGMTSKEGTVSNAEKAVSQISANFTNKLGSYFENSHPNVKKALANFNNTWSDNESYVSFAKKKLFKYKYEQSKGGIAGVRNLAKGSLNQGSNEAVMVTEMAKKGNLHGLYNEMREINAAVDFVDKAKFSGGIMQLLGIGGAMSNPATAPLAIPLISPRATAEMIAAGTNTSRGAGELFDRMANSRVYDTSLNMARKAKDVLSQLNPTQRNKVINNEAAIGQMLAPIAQAMAMEPEDE